MGYATAVGATLVRKDEGAGPSLPATLVPLREWILARKSADQSLQVELDTDLIEQRLIDSLEFAEFLFVLEEMTGKTIELEAVTLDAFRSLRSIQEHFLQGE